MICLQGSAEGRKEGLGAQLESGAGMGVADSGDLVRKTSEGPAGTVSLGQEPQALKVTPHCRSGFQEAGDIEIVVVDTGSTLHPPEPAPVLPAAQ